MSPTSRRIFLYWILLLVPTLVVGAGAIFLLRREQERLAERGAYADEARREALAARARLVVENVELLVGDVESGLLDVLAAEPAANLDAFLDQWEKGNPLVRATFRGTADGRILRPDMRTAGEDARGFLRRFTRHFGDRPPWSTVPLASDALSDKRQQKLEENEVTTRKEVTTNVAQVQSARRDVQELIKAPAVYRESDVAKNQPAASAASGLESRSRVTDMNRPKTSPAPTEAQLTQSDVAAGPTATNDEKKRNLVAAPATTAALALAKDAMTDRRGWSPALVDGRLHLFGWIQPGGVGEVRGVELELAALISRLGGVLPAEVSEGEGYALRDDQGRVLHQVGAIARAGAPVIRVPLAAGLLPGWEVAAFLPLAEYESMNGTPFLGVSVLLVGIFIAAILSGGGLLLRQARRSEEEAVQKTSFVANVSHEFKTPLTTIRLYSELLEQGRVRDAAQGGEYLRTIGRETQRLARLVNNALDFSRLEQGQKKYARESVDLAAELGRMLNTHGPRVKEAGLALQRDLPATPVRVTTDRDAVEQIVINLIDNACKYAAEGGEVTVTLAAGKLRPAGAGQGGGVEVRVADRGSGVPPEHRERIFEKFHRVDDALTAEKTGAGLGLSIARQLARGLGGELRYAARAGGGSEFILQLPP